MGIFAQILMGLAEWAPDNKTISIDATYLKAHRTTSSLWLKKGGRGRLIELTKGRMNTKLHAVTDTSGRPIRLFITAGQISDYTGADALMNSLPEADGLLADRGYDADWFRKTLLEKGTTPCIPGHKSRKKTVKYDKRRYTRRNRLERIFGRLKDWRRISTRYDRSPTVFLSVITLAAAVIFWL